MTRAHQIAANVFREQYKRKQRVSDPLSLSLPQPNEGWFLEQVKRACVCFVRGNYDSPPSASSINHETDFSMVHRASLCAFIISHLAL
jgi:hypothetical protein